MTFTILMIFLKRISYRGDSLIEIRIPTYVTINPKEHALIAETLITRNNEKPELGNHAKKSFRYNRNATLAAPA